MKKVKFFIFLKIIILAILNISCGMNPVEKSVARAVNRDAFFYHEDVEGDGYGPGYYVYPRNPEISREAFDLKSFTVEDVNDFVYMKFEFHEPVNRNNSYFGRFDQIMIDVYIDRDQQPYSGETKSLPGRDVEFKHNQGWESVVLVTPLGSEKIKKFLEYDYDNIQTKLWYKSGKIALPEFYVTSHKTITAKVPKKHVGEPRDWWGYQVLVMGFSEDNLTRKNLYVKPVSASAGSKYFGGGSNYYGNPNVLDILDDGKNFIQKDILSNYKISPNRENAKFVKLPMIYSKKIDGKEIIDIDVDVQAENFLKEQEKKLNQELISDKDVDNKENCRKNMEKIKDAAEEYKKENPIDSNFTFFDLLLAGFVTEEIKCSNGGMYRIEHGEENSIKVKCIDREGNILHGFVE
ncbi:MAG: glucodextranase DOMON-like domain-containing protein [Candidatus Muiribacteriota bacterium]